MTDALDVEPVRAALARLGLAAAGQLAPADRARMVAMLAKAETPTPAMMPLVLFFTLPMTRFVARMAVKSSRIAWPAATFVPFI